MTNRQLKKFVPLDKSWIIRMGVLDIVNGRQDIKKFLDKQSELNDDLLALKHASENWASGKPIDVGESGTLYRLLQFASWKLGLNKKFILKGTLQTRKISWNSNIVNWPIKKLLKLDYSTSQWATAAVLLGNKEKIVNPPYKLKLTYEAMRHWRKQRAKNNAWLPRYDETIMNQADAFLLMLKGKKLKFVPEQAEDYCFARVFNFISKEGGKKRWPNLQGHESNRIVEMERVIKAANESRTITSKDHRVVQAIVMWGKVFGITVKIKYRDAVSKSWPKFWDFIKYSSR